MEMNTLNLKLQILALLTEGGAIKAEELQPTAEALFEWCMKEAKIAEATQLSVVT